MRRLAAAVALAATCLAASPSLAQPGGAQPIPGCDIKVERALARASIDYIDRVTELARQFYVDLPEGGFGALSCLDRLFAGINIIFAPPNIGSILSTIESRVCAIVREHVDRAIQPLHRSINADVDLDRMLPGMGLGRLTAGIGISPHRDPRAPILNIVPVAVPTAPVPVSRGIFAR